MMSTTLATGSLNTLLTNLKVLSQIRQHERISTRTGNLIRIEAQDWMQPIRRWRNGESRTVNIDDMQQVIEHAFEHLSNSHDDARNLILRQRLLNELQAACQGLDRLRTTYEHDSVIKARLDLLIDTIEETLAAAATTNASPTVPIPQAPSHACANTSSSPSSSPSSSSPLSSSSPMSPPSSLVRG